MRLTHLGHACLLVETAEARILIDPGSFSSGFEGLRDLDAVVVTHQHPDHLDQDRLPDLLAHNRQAAVYADPQSAEIISGRSTDVIVLVEGEQHRVGAATLSPVGHQHAVIHPWVPCPANVGVVLRASGEPSLFHPGDSYDGQPSDVDVLAVPLSAPWAKVSETIDFVRRVAPGSIVPIHDALLAPAGRGMYLNHVRTYGVAEPGTSDPLTVHDPEAGVVEEILL